MNELPSSSAGNPSADQQQMNPQPSRPGSAPGVSASRPARVYPAVVAAFGILAVLHASQWWFSHTQIRDLRAEIAQRLQSSDALNNETKYIVKSVQDGTKDLQAKVSVLESKQLEAQSQQMALEQLYQDLLRNRDDWVLAEIEQVLSTASQQLQLAGNVQGALIALQNADGKLAGSESPQFITVRRAIASDIEKLKSLPSVDLTGIALRLDSIIGQVDAMPLLSDETPAMPATPPKNSNRTASVADEATFGTAAAADWLAFLKDKWDSWTTEMWTEVRQVIRVRNVETPDALMLSPTEAFYIRENLKLRLLNARVGLLARNESAFRSDLMAAQDTINRYFDSRARQTQTVLTLVRQVQASNVSIDMPTLAESLNAVRNYKAKP